MGFVLRLRLLACWWSPPCCVLRQSSLVFLLIKALISSDEVPTHMNSSNCSHLPKAPSANTTTLGVRSLTYEFGGARIQPITPGQLIPCKSKLLLYMVGLPSMVSSTPSSKTGYLTEAEGRAQAPFVQRQVLVHTHRLMYVHTFIHAYIWLVVFF